MPSGSIKADDINGRTAGGGKDELSNAEERRAAGDGKQFCNPVIRVGCVDLFIRVGQLNSPPPFER
jgi:hypothetical protein